MRMWIALALGLAFASSVHAMPRVPLQQTDGTVIPVREGCGLFRQLVDGVCVPNYKVRQAVRRCRSRGMRMVNGRCEPYAQRRPAQPTKSTPRTT